jgi:hypothetical protein
MMLEMTPKVDTMQGRSYYKLKLQMIFEYASFSIIILRMHKKVGLHSPTLKRQRWF